jgi:hypothetical protein
LKVNLQTQVLKISADVDAGTNNTFKPDMEIVAGMPAEPFRNTCDD